MIELIDRLTKSFGPSGFEDLVRELIVAEVEESADEIQTDALGNLIVLRRGKDSSKSIMICAHMDEIGVIATHIDDNGFVRFTNLGSLRSPYLMGSLVGFSNGTIGVIDCAQDDESLGKVKEDQMFIDVCACDRESCPIKAGDAAHFLSPFVVQSNRIIAKALDDRIGCAIQIIVLQQLVEPAYDSYFVFSVQEELGLRGAVTATYDLSPNWAIAVDVTAARDIPDAEPPTPITLGNGPAIKVKDGRMVTNIKFAQWMQELADANDLCYQVEVLHKGGTDAGVIQLARSGVVTGALSIPYRCVHEPSQIVDLKDVEDCIALLEAILQRPIEF